MVGQATLISARMQPLSAPVGGGEQRRLHLGPVRPGHGPRICRHCEGWTV